MSNYIAGLLALWMLKTDAFQPSGSLNPISKTVSPEARLPKLLGWIEGGLRADVGFLIAIAAAVGMWWLFRKSKLGFELRTVGTNADAARYAGMKIGTLTVVAMGLSGGLAGLAGGGQGARHDAAGIGTFAGDIGFDAIAIALLGRNSSSRRGRSPHSCSARWRPARQQMQLDADVPLDLVLVIRALIVLFIAAPMLTKLIWRIKSGESSLGLSFRGWGS